MGISIIPNQPILFRNTDEIEVSCDCNEQTFCQLINPIDETQFQIEASNEVTNGEFTDDLTGWVSQLPLTVEVGEIVNETVEGDCTGSVNVEVTNFTGDIEFSINGNGFWFAMSPATLFSNLCAGCYFIIFRDEAGKQASIEFCIVVSQCDAGTNTLDLLPFKTIDIRNCNTLDFI